VLLGHEVIEYSNRHRIPGGYGSVVPKLRLMHGDWDKPYQIRTLKSSASKSSQLVTFTTRIFS